MATGTREERLACHVNPEPQRQSYAPCAYSTLSDLVRRRAAPGTGDGGGGSAPLPELTINISMPVSDAACPFMLVACNHQSQSLVPLRHCPAACRCHTGPDNMCPIYSVQRSARPKRLWRSEPHSLPLGAGNCKRFRDAQARSPHRHSTHRGRVKGACADTAPFGRSTARDSNSCKRAKTGRLSPRHGRRSA